MAYFCILQCCGGHVLLCDRIIVDWELQGPSSIRVHNENSVVMVCDVNCANVLLVFPETLQLYM